MVVYIVETSSPHAAEALQSFEQVCVQVRDGREEVR